MNSEKLPLVTVITPAYNQGIFLRDTIGPRARISSVMRLPTALVLSLH